MDRTILNLSVKETTREAARKKILETWEQEKAGVSKYRYNVEICADKSQIYLHRPTRLNKGCDFVLFSENFLKYKKGTDRPPKHSDVFHLISSFTKEDKELIKTFHDAAILVYECSEPDDVIQKFPELGKTPDCAAERTLKLLKWLWIEQDITYWSGEGRARLWNALNKHLK